MANARANDRAAEKREAAWPERAARVLVAARREGAYADQLPISLRPQTLEEGFAIQQAVSIGLGLKIGAWKCALPSAGKVVVAPIYVDTVYSRPKCHLSARMAEPHVKAEPEIACVLKRDLPPRKRPYDEEDVLNALGDAHLALELLGSRYSNPAQVTFPELLADGLFNAGLVIGPKIELPEGATIVDFPAEFVISLAGCNEETLRFEGRHPDRSILAPIVWLTNYLCDHGLGLQAGQAVITGSYAGVFELPIGRDLRIVFGRLGSLPIHFSI
jgi:2-keto-4-pentenoate hydratase